MNDCTFEMQIVSSNVGVNYETLALTLTLTLTLTLKQRETLDLENEWRFWGFSKEVHCDATVY